MNPDESKLENPQKLLRAYLDESVPDLAEQFLKGSYPWKYRSRKTILEDVNIQKAVLSLAVGELAKPRRIPEAPDLDNVSWAKTAGFENPQEIEQSIKRIIAQIKQNNKSELMAPEEMQRLRDAMGQFMPPEFNSEYVRSYTAAARHLVQRAATEATYELVLAILQEKNPLQESEICSLLDSLCSAEALISDTEPVGLETNKMWEDWRDLPLPEVLSEVKDFKKRCELSAETVLRLEKLRILLIESKIPYYWTQKAIKQVEALCGSSFSLTLNKGNAWADRAMQDLDAMEPEARKAWNNVLRHAASAHSSKPSSKWKTKASEFIEAIGRQEFSEQVCAWLSLVGENWSHQAPAQHDRVIDYNQYLDLYSQMLEEFDPYNIDVLKGLVWCCSEMDDVKICQSLGELAEKCLHSVPYFGVKCSPLGRACLVAIASMPGEHPVEHLFRLKLKLKNRTARKQVERALKSVAERRNVSSEDLEDATVPTFGMEEPSVLRQTFGDYTTALHIFGNNTAQLVWVRPNGSKQTSIPAIIKRDFPDNLKELQKKKEEIKKILPLQRKRLENVYIRGRQWNFEKWHAYYINHPLVAILARRLIWRFQKHDLDMLGCWFAGRLIDIDDFPLEWLDKETKVSLWHPIGYDAETVLRWRDWLERHELQQPFKQAYREVYILTDAELQTGFYSNRFASHILRQSQFHMLCQQRKWKYSPRMRGYKPKLPIPGLSLAEWKLSAQFWIDPTDANVGEPRPNGVLEYITTDQVRFIDEAGQPVPLANVAPVVFSEVMRDVDLFVSVCSIGNDPMWREREPGGYWAQYSFGDLSESAKIRKQVLERIVPRLKIADRCSITDKYLVVRGDLRTYKIHLRSGNIMMEPNDQYLCIVRSRGGSSATKGQEKIFLPFEGDEMLSLILSKAFLLADDKNIKDQSILNQIK